MRFHVVNLPHTSTTVEDYSWCAYTTKVRRFCSMMYDLGHEVFLYGGPMNEARVTEHFRCTDLITMSEAGDHGMTLSWDNTTNLWTTFATNAIEAIRGTKQPGDFLCLISSAQWPIAEAHPDLVAVEFGIGYSGVKAPYRVWESYAWMHTVYGATAGLANCMSARGFNYDAVIPNFYEIEEFPLGTGAGDYLLYIGRLTELKGINEVAAIQKATGRKLIVAGQGDFRPDCEHEYVGVVGSEQRARLMGNARCVLYPTQYLEPFGGVAIESMLCGTPVLTTDWGAFTENVQPWARCRTLAEFVRGVEWAGHSWRRGYRLHAETALDFGTTRISLLYQDYFERLLTLQGHGWYSGVSPDLVGSKHG